MAVSLAAFLVRTFLFHFGLVLVLAVLVCLWLRRWRLLVAALPLLLATLGLTLWQYRPKSPPLIQGETVTVMSINLLSANRNTGPIIDEVRAARPEVLFLVEYTPHWHAAFQREVGGAYPYTQCLPRTDSFGLALYSRRAFVGDVECDLALGRGAVPELRAVIEIAGRACAVYNIHLFPPKGLKYAAEQRRQFADLLDCLDDEPLPVVLGGDFNFSETSTNAGALRRVGFVDAFSVGGWGRGSTWPVLSFYRWLPGLRLDHVYLRGGLTCADAWTGTGRGSDHRPIVTEIGFAR
ncbi:MAG: endonuclease/exonuclease/phosphatase family protein [Planctomycetes bacterium]|nr:endonuclease/exonuclease/phosphatase family protein [Planctomycetota bacterium]